MSGKIDFSDRMLSLGLARVSEAAAIASADLIGRGDEKAADQAAVNAMRDFLNNLAITGLMTTIHGAKPGPHIAVIGELDGLPVPGHPFSDKDTNAAHACGHHIQIGNMLATLFALNSEEILNNLSGSISFIAVPSEEYVEIEWRNEQRSKGEFEFLGGKQELVKLGIFDDIDISMMTHARGNFSGFGYGGTGNGLVAKFIEFHGKSSHAGGDPHLGINALNLDYGSRIRANVEDNFKGVLILDVLNEGPAHLAGIKGDSSIQPDLNYDGDIITKIDTYKIDTFEDLMSYLALNTEAGDIVKIEVVRDYNYLNIDVMLQARPD